MLPSHPPTDRPGAATARWKECGGHGPDLPRLCHSLRQAVKDHLSNMDGPASEASAASPTRFVAPCIRISPCAHAAREGGLCATQQRSQSVGDASLGRGRGDPRRRMAHPRGDAAPYAPCVPFLTTEPGASPRYLPPLTRSRGGWRGNVRKRVVRCACFGRPGGEVFRNVWPNPMAIQHYVTHMDDPCYLIRPLDHDIDLLQPSEGGIP